MSDSFPDLVTEHEHDEPDENGRCECGELVRPFVVVQTQLVTFTWKAWARNPNEALRSSERGVPERAEEKLLRFEEVAHEEGTPAEIEYRHWLARLDELEQRVDRALSYLAELSESERQSGRHVVEVVKCHGWVRDLRAEAEAHGWPLDRLRDLARRILSEGMGIPAHQAEGMAG